MTRTKRDELRKWLLTVAEAGDKEQVRKLVLLMTLVAEAFFPGWMIAVHTQNMIRAEAGRDSEEAKAQSHRLKHSLNLHAQSLEAVDVSAENLKRLFAECNTGNAWSQTSPAEKAVEELKELAAALDSKQHDERTLDAILDFVYAGTEVPGIHC